MQLELREDDPEAMMALLHFIYGLPYNQLEVNDSVLLQHHALVSMLAQKYQVHSLQEEACGAMKAAVRSPTHCAEDFFSALRIVFDPAMQDSKARACMVAACVAELRVLKRNVKFRSLWQEIPGLSLEILDHPDMDNGLE